jgi:SAM-dependent methyltransferase
LTNPDAEAAQPCPACGERKYRVLFQETDRLYRTTTRPFEVIECGGCRLIRLHPWPSSAELRTYYPDDYWFAPSPGAAERLEELYRRVVLRDHLRFVRTAIRNAGGSGLLLDVGCGGGLFLGMLAQSAQAARPGSHRRSNSADLAAPRESVVRESPRSGVRIAGLDFSWNAARIAWAQKGAPAVCADLAMAPFAAQSCSVITMFHVVEHLYDPAAYLTAAHRLLQPDGRLVVQVPNASSWQFHVFGKRWSGIDVPRHLIDFRQRDLDRLLGDCGFEPVRYKHFSLRDNPAGLATTLAPSLDPMARRIRRTGESSGARLLKDLVYMALVMASVPFTALEAAFGAGSTIMVEARKKR